MATKQTDRPIQKLSLQASSRPAYWLAEMFFDGQADLAPEYQRGSVWIVDQQISLVHSYLLGAPIPAVILNSRLFGAWPEDPSGPAGGFSHACVDGRQRIEATHAWFSGALAVPASWFEPEDVLSAEQTEDGLYVRFTGLSQVCQRRQKNGWVLPVVESAVATLEEEAQLYLLVNGSGTAQSANDLENASSIAGRGEPKVR